MGRKKSVEGADEVVLRFIGTGSRREDGTYEADRYVIGVSCDPQVPVVVDPEEAVRLIGTGLFEEGDSVEQAPEGEGETQTPGEGGNAAE